MSQWISPSFDDLKTVIKASCGKLILCSPYIKGSALKKVVKYLPGAVTKIEVWTKLSKRDWLVDASDLPALAKFQQEQHGKGCSVGIYCLDDLHAKIIISDGPMALAGSANLTQGGFERNTEIARIVNKEEIEQLRGVVREIEGKVTPVSEDELQDFVSWCESNRGKKQNIQNQLPKEARLPSSYDGWIRLSDFDSDRDNKPSHDSLSKQRR